MIKVNNRKKDLTGFDLIKLVDELRPHTSVNYETQLESIKTKERFNVWTFDDLSKGYAKPINDRETVEKIYKLITTYYPKAEVRILDRQYRYAPEQKQSVLAIKTK